jgi:uncharacterized protein YodC (DUF2158 family)
MLSKQLTIYPVGTQVFLNQNSLEAIISRITLTGLDHRPSYECEWWDGAKVDSHWFYEHQIAPINATKKAKIGFACQN